MKFLVTLERDEDGWVVAECPALPGCATQGREFWARLLAKV